VPELVDHVDHILHQIYNYKEDMIKQITPLNFDKLAMKIKYRNTFVDGQHMKKIDIRNVNDNPFKKMNNTEIRVRILSKLQSITIIINIEFSV
jgi:hypothetical protein